MAWIKPDPPFAAWLVERTGSTRRITQDGRRRIAEQGDVRIIERFETSWSLDPPAAGTWT